MAKSKYEFKKLKTKSLPAKIGDSTAVRVLAKAAKKMSSGWKKFVVYSGSFVSNIKAENSKIEETEKIATKIETNQNLINTIKQDEKATSADFKVMGKAQAENERLAVKLQKLLNKKVTVETKAGSSEDLNQILNAELDEEKEVMASTLDELNKAFDEAGIKAVEAPVVEQPVVQAPVEEPKVVPMAPTPVEEPKVAPVEQKPVTNEMTQVDPVVNQVLSAINKAKELETFNRDLTVNNQRLMTEGKSKDERIANLEANMLSLTNQNKTLSNDSEILKQTNANQVVSIANLTKANETLKVSLKNQNVMEQKISDYEGVISKHERERADMERELQELRTSAKDNETQITKIEMDLYKITKERDYYRSQIVALQNALGMVPPVETSTVGEENRVR